MSASGLGQDGYVRIQKETTWGTGVTSGMTLLPVRPDCNINAVEEFINRDDVVGNRLEQDPGAGRIKVDGDLHLYGAPSLLGLLLNIFLGTSTDGSVSDSTYEHTWLCPLTGERVAKSFTAQQARGGDLAEQYVGGMITGMTITGDSSGHIVFKFNTVYKSYSSGVSRISSFTYPSTAPYNFSHATVSIDPLSPANDSAIAQLMNSFELNLDLGYDLSRFKLGSRSIVQPVFETKPKLSLKMNIDADSVYTGYARTQETFQITLQILHAAYAAGTTPYRTQIEIPTARLNPSTLIKNGKDRLKMDLDFMCNYGGTTTGGGSTNQLVEIRHRDATAAYA